MNRFRTDVPPSLFGMVVGLVGLGNAWRVASRIWQAPTVVGEALMAAAALSWAVLILLYAAKWWHAPQTARAEIEHPVQSGFVALVPLTTLLMALVVAPYSRGLAVGFWVLGTLGQLGLGVWLNARLWQGGRDESTLTTVLYLPTVGVNFVAATVAGSLGFAGWGALFFGAAALSWLSLESVILRRHALQAPLPPALRATLGIQLAPPVVGAMAYLSMTEGPPDLLAHALFGYGLLQALLLLRLWPWLTEQALGAGGWAFTFGITAMAVVPMRMLERGGTGPESLLALPLFGVANLFVGALVIVTLRLLMRGALLPAPRLPLPGAPQP